MRVLPIYLLTCLVSNVCFAEKSASSSKQAAIALANNGRGVKDNVNESPHMKSSLQEFFNTWSTYQHVTPRSGTERFGGVLAQESREDMFMYFGSNSETAFFSTKEIHFANAAETRRAFDSYMRESDPVRGHAIAWEVVIPKGDRIFYMRTGREFPQRTKLLDAFLKAIDAPNAPKLICVDTYGCRVR